MMQGKITKNKIKLKSIPLGIASALGIVNDGKIPSKEDLPNSKKCSH